EDNSPANTIKLDMSKQKEVVDYIKQNISEKQKQKLNDVSLLIDGFETPFSLELLSTVDFILKANPEYTPKNIFENIQNWTHRKKDLMKLYHIQVAVNRLNEFQASFN
ncbi:unnamed protein product, partial [marine sediment metagenome]